MIEKGGDVVVAVEAAGLCGSDLHPYCGREDGLDVGTVMGHEFVGEIVAAGCSVRDLSIGDRVVAPFSTCCGACFFCRRGLPSRCETGQLFGWVENGIGLHGGQAELVRVPDADASLVKLPEGVPTDLALLAADILPTGLFAAELGDVAPDTSVAVIGCGPVGLLAIMASRLSGAGVIFAIDSVPERLALAADFGARSINAGRRDAVGEVLAGTGGRGADAALEIVGSAAAARLAMDLVRTGGVVATVGFHTEPRFAFSPGEAYDKNLTYRTGRCPARRLIGEALEIVVREGPTVERLITHRLPLADGPRAYQLFNDKLESCIKVALHP